MSLDQYVGREDNYEESLIAIESKGIFKHRPSESFNITDRGITSQVNDLGEEAISTCFYKESDVDPII